MCHTCTCTCHTCTCMWHTCTCMSNMYMHVSHMYMHVSNMYMYVSRMYMYVSCMYMYVWHFEPAISRYIRTPAHDGTWSFWNITVDLATSLQHRVCTVYIHMSSTSKQSYWKLGVGGGTKKHGKEFFVCVLIMLEEFLHYLDLVWVM